MSGVVPVEWGGAIAPSPSDGSSASFIHQGKPTSRRLTQVLALATSSLPSHPVEGGFGIGSGNGPSREHQVSRRIDQTSPCSMHACREIQEGNGLRP
ncbi:hypothetical protein Naga_101701g2 [Nannochloropsis gaditana]|uniref:Uncharacterized protein n=1 Tax=Nannochloropsis gaditana TaxID=72520 RepID=W7T4S3_9STRA|nr:hypothetical protein Naga_101701g2 [Nannochloropsis gaditana]